MAPETQTGTPAPDVPGSVEIDTEQVVAELIAASQALKALEATLAAREKPWRESIADMEIEMKEALQELTEQKRIVEQDLADRKEKLIAAWPVHTGRIEKQGWTIDRKERKSVEIKSEEMLTVALLHKVSWDKQPFSIKFNHTKLAKLVDNGVIPEEIAEPTVTVSIAVTPPKVQDLLDEEQAAMEKLDAIEDARKEAEQGE